MSKLPDVEALALFAKVAEAGSFSAAAEDAGLSKATVSKAVGRLEARLGTALFHRTSRRLSLTETGVVLAARAARILAEGEAAEAEAAAEAVAPRGRVKLAAPMSFGLRHLGPALPEFLQRYPDISVDLQLSDQTVDLIAGGFDAALRIGALVDSSLRARRLADVPRLTVGAPAYFEKHGRPEHPRDLKRHACLDYAYMPGGAGWRYINRVDGREETVKVSGPLVSNNTDVQVPTLLAGLGVAIAPEFLVADELADGRLEAVLPDWTPPPIALHLVTPPSSPRPSKVTALVEFLAKRFAG
ncbi:LysR family transcriptional regulator [Caulobacter sp. 17J80-11]|uniref:LysR family transcriptional regulator n=1 Tax=Caulobacter sp. 17J80-11 TaxID=2763502 RepID=UPI001653D996|nr:LysR family transcriptional regulator [Caulobacter sp. 17J80-11]MBC6982971.1 LysR family transcriptional regulator [Caulobacter sp. 17J80-11]